MSEESRVKALKELLANNPDDKLARYALAMEYSGAGDTNAAVSEFRRLLEFSPDYTNAYFMAAQTLARADRCGEAKTMLERGIECARRTRNSHAEAEMQSMLDELERGY
jgi:predicted Zn-dependent protease